MGFNHPLPHLGMMVLLTFIIFVFFLWILLPSTLLAEKEFRRKLLIYTGYFYWTIVIAIQKEVLSYLFVNLPAKLQFIVTFVIAACKEFDMKVRSKMVHKMMGDLDEPASILLAVTVNSAYGFFVAIRLVGAELSTVCCAIGIDFFLHIRTTIRIIRQYNKITVSTAHKNMEIRRLTSKFVIAEAIEGLIPFIYGICMAMAYYGPNGHILGNIKNSYWGYQEIENITKVFFTMFILFAVDILSIFINSVGLWKITNIEMHQEFLRVFKHYWVFMAVKLGYVMTTYFSGSDINFGQDGTYTFNWITDEGRISLICNSTEIAEQERKFLFGNMTCI